MSDHHHGPPMYEQLGEEPRWLDKPQNLKRLTRWFFATCALVALLDVSFFLLHKHNSFEAEAVGGSEGSVPEGFLQSVESWFGYYSLYGFVAIVLLVVLSVGLRKLVMQPEDFYSRDYGDPDASEADAERGDAGGAHHG